MYCKDCPVWLSGRVQSWVVCDGAWTTDSQWQEQDITFSAASEPAWVDGHDAKHG